MDKPKRVPLDEFMGSLLGLQDHEENRLAKHAKRYGGPKSEKRKRATQLFKELGSIEKVAERMEVTPKTVRRWFQ